MINTFEENDFRKDDWEPYLDEVSISYYQTNDCTESGDEGQSMVVSTRNNGVGRFINIKTDNWSIGSIEELVEIIKDFCQRAGIKNFEKDEERNAEQGPVK